VLDALAEPIGSKRAVIMQQTAFQAGCRGFEPRLPLLPLQLSLLKALFRLNPEDILFVNVLIMRMKLEHLMYNLGQLGTMMDFPGNPSR
jgi:hypothetical protein